VARRIAGTGSLGLERYVILVNGKGSPDNNYLLDMKAAVPSSLAICLPIDLKEKQPLWKSQAQRVVTLQQRIQAVPMNLLRAADTGGADFVVRGLQPSEDRVAISDGQLTLPSLRDLVVTMGRIVAWSHLRSGGLQGAAIADSLIAYGQQSNWQERIVKNAYASAKLARVDWDSYCKAYSAGAFNVHSDIR